MSATCTELKYIIFFPFTRKVPNNKQIYPLVNLELISWTALSFAAIKGHVNVCQVRCKCHVRKKNCWRRKWGRRLPPLIPATDLKCIKSFRGVSLRAKDEVSLGLPLSCASHFFFILSHSIFSLPVQFWQLVKSDCPLRAPIVHEASAEKRQWFLSVASRANCHHVQFLSPISFSTVLL